MHRNGSRPGALTCPVLVLVGLSLLGVAGGGADEWHRFRGPNGTGVSSTATLPGEFGEEALRWSTAIPFGRSSPVVAGERLFMTAIAAGRLVTLAVDRQGGELLWWRSIERAREASLHPATDSATPTPATDGANVYAFFQEAGVISYDSEGNERWRRPLGPFRNYYGMAASPIVVGDRVIVLCDQAGGSFLLALDRETGEVAWRQDRPARRESYSTPVLYPDAAAPRLLLVGGSKHLDAYDPQTGEHLWEVPGLGAGPVASPVVAGDLVFVVGPNQSEELVEPFAGLLTAHDGDGDGRLTREELAGHWTQDHFGFVDADADGWLTAEDWTVLETEVTTEGWGLFAISLAAGDDAPEIVWNHRPNAAYIPTPVVLDGVIYMVKDSVLTSLDAASGELIQRGRIPAKRVYASPVAAGDRLLIASLEGRLSLLRAGRDWEVLSTHDLEDEVFAAPALTAETLYVRTRGRLLAYTTGR